MIARCDGPLRILTKEKTRTRSESLRRMRVGLSRARQKQLGTLEDHLERELERARAIVLVAVLRGRDVAEVRCCEVQLPRLSEGRRVGRVKRFRAELQVNGFREVEVLQDRRIQIGEMRSA